MQLTPGVALTATATDSGAGIAAAISGDARIGASDSYMSDEQAEQHPSIVNIPLAISAQTVNYNVPGLNDAGLKLDGPTLAAIYTGAGHAWDAAPITALNPGVKLPHQTIVPIRRKDDSGDTLIFTQFLDFSTQSWEDRIGYGTACRVARGGWRENGDRERGHGRNAGRDAVFDRLYRHQLPRRHRQGRAGDCAAQESERQVPAANSGNRERGSVGTRSADAGR